MKTLLFATLVILIISSTSVWAQDELPRPEDVSTLDGIMAAYYDVVSHAAGEPLQSERDFSLHYSKARAAMTGIDSTGTPFMVSQTLPEYHESAAKGIGNAFYEWEVAREVRRFGNIAHVWSTYAYSTEPGGEVMGRGINSIHLYNDGERWWITGWIFDSERPGNEIPGDR